MADIGEPQQSASGDWVLFDGKIKRRFAEKADADIAKRRLEMSNAVVTLEKLVLANTAQAQALMDGLSKPSRIWTANGLNEIVGGTLDGELVPGSVLTKERWLMLAELFSAFQVWLDTPLAGCGLSPAIIVSIEDGTA